MNRLIYIEWEDANARAGWHSREGLEEYWNDERCLVKEVGWVYKENKHYILLYGRTQEWGLDGSPEAQDEGQQFGLLQKIPQTWIRKRIDLTRHIAPPNQLIKERKI